MNTSAQGIPGLPDLTHPNELIKFGEQIIQNSLLLVVLVIGLGIAIALINFSLRQETREQTVFFGEWSIRYSQLLKGLQHLALILILTVTGFFLTSTLGNRYHHWEQAKIAQVAESVAGDKLEQIAPQIRYITEEPYTYTTQVNGKIVRVTDKQQVTRFLNLASSNIKVKIDQGVNVQNRSAIYITEYNAEYKFINQLSDINSFFLEAPPPMGYTLLSSYQVEKDGKIIAQKNPGDYGFPFQLEPGQETTLKISYQAQGGPRWVYNASNQLLSKFQLTATANFKNADFASGIIPQAINSNNNSTEFIWKFDNNVSVRNPFGVFTSTQAIAKTGIIPRLLLLAPGLFLWWILLLYLSIPMSLKNVAITAGIFFACLLTLTYTARLMNAEIALLIIAGLSLGLTYSFRKNQPTTIPIIICTITGAILPVFGLLIPYSGLTLSLAALLSVGWLAVHNSVDMVRS
ncbi:MAG: hypothetical protein EAZ76_08300 [Nostocales cyanobacterium]|nr:MAG: hypothetical protein EAZ87_14725 [Nostocales cyanobacterium]TAF15686.1 MAG: hypothetical protein EAZ76_08300 [Nostocales cyanobacterium]